MGATGQPSDLVVVDPGGGARNVAGELAAPNGMVITEDGSTLIVAEFEAHRLLAFTIRSDGSLSDAATWADLPDRLHARRTVPGRVGCRVGGLRAPTHRASCVRGRPGAGHGLLHPASPGLHAGRSGQEEALSARRRVRMRRLEIGARELSNGSRSRCREPATRRGADAGKSASSWYGSRRRRTPRPEDHLGDVLRTALSGE